MTLEGQGKEKSGDPPADLQTLDDGVASLRMTSPTTTDAFSMLSSQSGRSPYPSLEALDYPPERLFPGCGRLAYDSSKLDRKRGMSCASSCWTRCR